jgi:hypothetical protein
MPLLTIFTAPKPFIDPHITVIQRNALKNWLALGDEVEVFVLGDDPGVSETCAELGIRHISGVKCNDQGTPLISSIFNLSRQASTAPFLAYVNADILILPNILDAIRLIGRQKDQFLAVGQRWDLDIREPMTFDGPWEETLRKRIEDDGELHGQTGSDYFIFPRGCFKKIPDFAVGRAGWDNWMIYRARWQHWPVVDTTKMITILHQNHDYRHLPGGQTHYRLPESAENIKMGGGRRTIFNLTDATHLLEEGVLKRISLDTNSFWREVEIFPLVGLRSRVLGWLSFAIIHPQKAFTEFKEWLVKTIKAS